MSAEEAAEYALSEEVAPAHESSPACGETDEPPLPISSAPGNAKWRLW
jgi:hypothetical protein